MIPSKARGGRRTGAGRKPAAGVARSETIRACVTEAEKAELQDAAGRAGVDLSTVARNLLLEWLARSR